MPANSSSTPTRQLATLADLLAIPEAERFHEILDGELLPKELAGPQHALGQGNVRGWLTPFQRRANGPDRPGGWWILTEVTIELAPHQVERPDVAGWRRERMPQVPTAFPLRLRPDWICEVLTDSDGRRRDGLQKRRIYADHQIPHYWLLDMERQTLTVLRWTERGYIEVLDAGRTERVRAEPFDSRELAVGELFGDDAD